MPVYNLSKHHLDEIIDDTSKKIAGDNCNSANIRTQLSSPFARELSTILSFVEKYWKLIRKGKLEKFHSLFFAKVVLKNAIVFPTLMNDASTKLLTKLSQSLVCDFRRWSKKDTEASILEQ